MRGPNCDVAFSNVPPPTIPMSYPEFIFSVIFEIISLDTSWLDSAIVPSISNRIKRLRLLFSLVKMTLKLDGVDEAKQWLKNKNFISQIVTNVEKPLIKSSKNFDINILDRLENKHDYWLNRSVHQETISQFKGGVAHAGKMKNRYVFPIFNLKNSESLVSSFDSFQTHANLVFIAFISSLIFIFRKLW